MILAKNITSGVESYFTEETWKKLQENGRHVLYRIIERTEPKKAKTFTPPELTRKPLPPLAPQEPEKRARTIRPTKK